MQNQSENRVYAGFFVRLIAFAIDSLLAALLVGTIKAPFALAASEGIEIFNANFLFHYSILDVLDYVAVAAYFVLLTYYGHTTPGKYAMGLEVITMDKEWTLLNVIYRETVGRFFSSLMCAGYFAVIVTGKKQGFHDMLCDTYVVYRNMVAKKATVSVVNPPVYQVKPMVDNNVVMNNNVPVTLVAEPETVPSEVSVPAEHMEAEQANTITPTYYYPPMEETNFSQDVINAESSDVSVPVSEETE